MGIDDPVASLLNRYFEVSTPKRVIDDSPGEDEGELDHIGRDAAVEYLVMPERVKKLEGQSEGIASTLDTVRRDLSRAATVALSSVCRVFIPATAPPLSVLKKVTALIIVPSIRAFSQSNLCSVVSVILLVQ